MLRITSRAANSECVVLQLAGQIKGRWVEELERVCDDVRNRDRLLVLDLADVMFIDADGVELFRKLGVRRVRITNCSLFAAEQLKEVIDGDR